MSRRVLHAQFVHPMAWLGPAEARRCSWAKVVLRGLVSSTYCLSEVSFGTNSVAPKRIRNRGLL